MQTPRPPHSVWQRLRDREITCEEALKRLVDEKGEVHLEPLCNIIPLLNLQQTLRLSDLRAATIAKILPKFLCKTLGFWSSFAQTLSERRGNR